MLERSGETLLIAPYEKRSFKSHAVPREVYNGTDSMEISSMKLCRSIADLHRWETNHSYRIPGKVLPEKRVVVFNLKAAELIGKEKAEPDRYK